MLNHFEGVKNERLRRIKKVKVVPIMIIERFVFWPTSTEPAIMAKKVFASTKKRHGNCKYTRGVAIVQTKDDFS